MVKPKLAVPTSKASHDAERVASKTMVTYRCSVPAAASNLGIVREPTIRTSLCLGMTGASRVTRADIV